MPHHETTRNSAGSVISIHRYPVKSMMGEEVDGCDVTGLGLVGDRAYALIDTSEGKVVSAKNPRKWSRLLEFHAGYTQEPRPGKRLPEVRVTIPDEAEVSSDDRDVHRVLSRALGREVRLHRRERGQEGIAEAMLPNSWMPRLEEYWPEDVDGLAYRGVVTDEAIPDGTFFDLAMVHLLTTATLDRLRQVNPEGQYDVRRFRPNLLVQAADGQAGFVENDWIGKTLRIGNEVQLQITGPCPRCVMTTLPQQGLPKDTSILRAAVQHNGANVGVYASIVQSGHVRKGDTIQIL